MNAEIYIKVDTDLLIEQRALIDNLIANLKSGRTGIAIKRDLVALIGIQGILDAVADSTDDLGCPGCGGESLSCSVCSNDDIPVDSFNHLDHVELTKCAKCSYRYHSVAGGACPVCGSIVSCSIEDEGPTCPGCTHPGDCEDCEYTNN